VVVLGAEAGATVAEAAIRTAQATFFISMVFLRIVERIGSAGDAEQIKALKGLIN
jgi:hypothetical protein